MDRGPAAHVPDRSHDDAPAPSAVLEDLIARAHVLLRELEALRDRLRRFRQEGSVELGHFRGSIQSELGMLERLRSKSRADDADGDNHAASTAHVAKSSNLPFLETLWTTAKRSHAVVALQKRVHASSHGHPSSSGLQPVPVGHGAKKKPGGPKERAVIVDAVTDGGRAWTKVSLVNHTRLLFDLAKQGWEVGGSDSEDEAESSSIKTEGKQEGEDEDHDVPLLKTAKELTRAARCFRVRTKVPTVHLVLPRIHPGQMPEIDAILDDCRAAGAILHCGDEAPGPLDLADALCAMAPDPVASFSDVLNIDCTILLALVSEFSHAKVSKEPWFHAALRRQVEIEGNENLLPSLLYPAMGRHPLVCTREAVTRMREIVDTIGTPSEKARTAILLGDDASKSPAQLLAEMQEWSAYEVPAAWQLPIRIVDPAASERHVDLPPAAAALAHALTPINRSVFLYGWAARRTTITSNRMVVKQIEGELDRCADLADALWPSIWLCPTARSLVGKEKRGAKREEGAPDKKKTDGVWPLPDPLRREEQRRNGLDVLSRREGHPVEDRRPGGYQYCQDVIAAKNASSR